MLQSADELRCDFWIQRYSLQSWISWGKPFSIDLAITLKVILTGQEIICYLWSICYIFVWISWRHFMSLRGGIWSSLLLRNTKYATMRFWRTEDLLITRVIRGKNTVYDSPTETRPKYLMFPYGMSCKKDSRDFKGWQDGLRQVIWHTDCRVQNFY